MVWVEEREALAIHQRLLVLHGGAGGVRDEALLQSALARPRQAAAYADDPAIADLAALYTAGIVRNHPFIDGNKRTGFVLGVLFLELNGFIFNAAQEDAANAVLRVADGSWTKRRTRRFSKRPLLQGASVHLGARPSREGRTERIFPSTCGTQQPQSAGY
ncbi:MAG: type II toxin-antitoxin system death-on-curing family toxin [Hyphomicrobiales bacterium]|nr:type II toxin-antitoxin system death-on-curing family toxin [Hyphomicrobiales bacterium]